MSEKWKLKQSRDKWKQKCIERSKKNCELRKEIKRIKAERDRFKQAARSAKWAAQALQRKAEAEKAVLEKQQRQLQNLVVPDKKTLVHLALLLFCVARIGCRATSRVLKVMAPYLGLQKTPCAQTISNWVARFSIVKTQNALAVSKNTTEKFLWMMDLSIGLGSGKILSILALRLKHHEHCSQAPTLRDVQCVAVAVADSWTGEDIANFVNPIIKLHGQPCAFLKDGGGDLNKAVDILEERGISCPKIADLSHTIANLFKNTYGKHPLYQTFVSACGQVSKNLKQTLLACLAPPKVSTKARFMNLHKLVAWADQLLAHSRPGAAACNSLLVKLRAKLDQLPQCKTFIQRFRRDAQTLLECQKLLKNKGLSTSTVQECETIIAAMPMQPAIRKGFLTWAQQQLAVAAKLELKDIGLPVSTDPIESLFAVGKRLGNGQMKDAERIALRIPVFCGASPTLDDAQKVLAVSVKQQKQWLGDNRSLLKQRRDVLSCPEKLETLARPPGRKRFQLTASATETKIAA